MEVYDRKPLDGLASTGGLVLALFAGAFSIEHITALEPEPPAHV